MPEETKQDTPVIDPAITAELNQLREKTAKLQAERDSLAKAAKLHSYATDPQFDFIDPEMVARFVDADIVYENGAVRGKGGKTVAQILSAFKNNNEYLTKSHFAARMAGTNGANPKATFNGSPEFPVDKLFGKGSDPGLANKLALKDVKEYRRLREVARRRGLID